jgi:glutaredoxin
VRRLTLYSKPGCHLCEDVRSLLDEIGTSHSFAIEEVDITKNDTLFARYRFAIPVALIDGEEVGRGRITERDLLDALERSRPLSESAPESAPRNRTGSSG